jgi:hypothetical protein
MLGDNMENVMSNKHKSYIELIGDPKKLSRADISMNITAMERVSEPFYEWYYEAKKGTEYEDYLHTRIADMGDYLVLCYDELNRRKETKSDVVQEASL